MRIGTQQHELKFPPGESPDESLETTASIKISTQGSSRWEFGDNSLNKDFHPVKLQVRIQKSQLKLRIPPRKAPDERGHDQQKGAVTSEREPWPAKRGHDQWNERAMTSERGPWPAKGAKGMAMTSDDQRKGAMTSFPKKSYGNSQCVFLRICLFVVWAKPSPRVTEEACLETVNLKRCVFLRSCLFERSVWAKPSPGVTYRACLETVNLKRCVFLKSCLFERSVWAKPSPSVTEEACLETVNLKSFVFVRSFLFERSL